MLKQQTVYNLFRVCLPVTFPLLKKVRELAQRSMCIGGC